MQPFGVRIAASWCREQPVRCKTSEEAIRRAAAMKESRDGVAAYTVSEDSETGDYDERRTVLFRAATRFEPPPWRDKLNPQTAWAPLP